MNAQRTAKMIKNEPSFYHTNKYYVSLVSDDGCIVGFTVERTSLMCDEYDTFFDVDCSGTMIPQKPKPQQLPPSMPLRPAPLKRKEPFQATSSIVSNRKAPI